MAKPRGSVRMGPISLFALIIILCLAVLAVLSLSTAMAELSTTERQAQTTSETYQLESVGQQFLAEVDDALGHARVTDNHARSALADDLSDVFSAYGITLTAAASEASDGETAETAEVIIEEEEPAAPVNEVVIEVPETTVDKMTVTDDDGIVVEVTQCPVVTSDITASGTYDGEHILATFCMESGRQLACDVVIHEDGTYDIASWKVTTQWLDDGTGETLWLG